MTDSNPFPQESALYFKVAERKLGWQNKVNGSWYEIEDEKALVRVDNGQPHWLANVGSSYNVVQNEELYKYIEEVMLELDIDGPKDTFHKRWYEGVQVHDSMAFNGRHCYRDYIFPQLTCDVGHRSINFRIWVGNGFGGSAVQMMAGAYEMICTNGMIIGFGDKTVRKHTSGLEIPALGKWVGDSIDLFLRTGPVWKQWHETRVTDELVQEWLHDEPTISKLLADRLFARWQVEAQDRGFTAWALYNALTHFATHNMVSPLRDTGNDHAAKTIMDRHRQVNKWVNGRAWIDHIAVPLRQKVT